MLIQGRLKQEGTTTPTPSPLPRGGLSCTILFCQYKPVIPYAVGVCGIAHARSDLWSP
jgi:hypothetical protein